MIIGDAGLVAFSANFRLQSTQEQLRLPKFSPVDISDAIGRIFRDIEMSTTFLLFVFSYKMKTNHTSLVLSGVCTDLMPCLSRTEEMNEVHLGLVTFSPLLLRHCYLQWPWPLSPSFLPTPSPPVLPLHQSLCRWGETMCSEHSPPHTSCLFSLCCSPQGWKGIDSFCRNFMLKWDLSHANCRQ